MSRIQWIEEDVVRRGRLEAGGWSAMGAEMLSGAIDPISLGAGFATGGLGFVAKGGMMARVAAGAGVGAVTGAGLDYASKEVFDDPYADPYMAGIVGASFGALGGALVRNRSTQLEADLAFTTGALTKAGKLRSGAAEAVISGTPMPAAFGQQIDSMGAARNTSFRDNLIPSERAYLGEVSDEAVTKGYGGWSRFDVAGQMTTSDNPLVRLLGFNLFEETAGAVDHSVIPDSVNSIFTADHRRVIGNYVMEYTPAKSDYLKSRGVGRLSLFERGRVRSFVFGAWGSAETAQKNGLMVVNYFGRNKLVADIGAMDIAEMKLHFGEEGLAPATVNRKVSALSKMLHVAVDAGVIPRVPRIRWNQEMQTRFRYLDETEEAVLLAYWKAQGDEALHDLCLLLIDTGARCFSEMLPVRWDHFGPKFSTVTFWHTKTNTPRTVPLTQRSRAILQKRRTEMPKSAGPFSGVSHGDTERGLTKHSMRHKWDAMRCNTGMSDVTPHTLRHTCCTRLILGGADIKRVMTWMGPDAGAYRHQRHGPDRSADGQHRDQESLPTPL